MINKLVQGRSIHESVSAKIAILWKSKWLIILGTVATTLLAIAFVLLIPRTYRSEGFFQLGNPEFGSSESGILTGVSIPLYKKNSPEFLNPDRLIAFAGQINVFNSAELDEIKGLFRKKKDIQKCMSPIYAYSKEDMRDFMQTTKADVNSVIGLHLGCDADSPQKANRWVHLLGNYIRDCMLHQALNNYIMNQYSKAISGISKNENDLIENRFILQQETEKEAEIKAILTKYPETKKIDERQLVSVQNHGGRYLPPMIQLVGIRSTLAELSSVLASLERQREKLAIFNEYFSRCQAEMKNAANGEALFSMVKSLKTEVFKNKDFTKDPIKEVANILSIDLQMYDLVFFKNSRFISGPNLSSPQIRQRKAILVMLAFLFSFFVFVMLAFGREWWRRNKEEILSDKVK